MDPENESTIAAQRQEFFSLLKACLADSKITLNEIAAIRSWYAKNLGCETEYPYSDVYDAILELPDEDKIPSKQLAIVKNAIVNTVDPVMFLPEVKTVSIRDHVFCLTGEFKHGREKTQEYIEAKGGIVVDTYKKAVNYIVIGKPSSEWAFGLFGTKILNGIADQRNGCDVVLIKENDFCRLTRNKKWSLPDCRIPVASFFTGILSNGIINTGGMRLLCLHEHIEAKWGRCLYNVGIDNSNITEAKPHPTGKY